jgi:molybdopterin-guanine dinucleotide biosynthesis protein A|uniref:Probable molybdenum cofactor guanylyltransferase n=1 Tax=Desulfobacca acetoxidans TaxID=60893 RepID=A0A7V6DPP7_9BACT
MTISAGIDTAPPCPQVTGAILAGGSSRRFGQDKATLQLGGKPLARWVAAALGPAVADLWLVTNHPLQHLSLGLPLVTDLVPFQGPVGGLAAALFYARTPWVLLASADTPLLTPALATALAGAAGSLTRPALVCRTERGLEPFPGLYAVRLFNRVQDFLKEKRNFMGFLEGIRPSVWPPDSWRAYDPEGASFENVNRPEDLTGLAARVPRQHRDPGAGLSETLNSNSPVRNV